MKIELNLADREIDQLRELMGSLPLGKYAPLVVAVLKALPLTAEHAYLQDIADERECGLGFSPDDVAPITDETLRERVERSDREMRRMVSLCRCGGWFLCA